MNQPVLYEPSRPGALSCVLDSWWGACCYLWWRASCYLGLCACTAARPDLAATVGLRLCIWRATCTFLLLPFEVAICLDPERCAKTGEEAKPGSVAVWDPTIEKGGVADGWTQKPGWMIGGRTRKYRSRHCVAYKGRERLVTNQVY